MFLPLIHMELHMTDFHLDIGHSDANLHAKLHVVSCLWICETCEAFVDFTSSMFIY